MPETGGNALGGGGSSVAAPVAREVLDFYVPGALEEREALAAEALAAEKSAAEAPALEVAGRP